MANFFTKMGSVYELALAVYYKELEGDLLTDVNFYQKLMRMSCWQSLRDWQLFPLRPLHRKLNC